jgi:hypothetical protein
MNRRPPGLARSSSRCIQRGRAIVSLPAATTNALNTQTRALRPIHSAHGTETTDRAAFCISCPLHTQRAQHGDDRSSSRALSAPDLGASLGCLGISGLPLLLSTAAPQPPPPPALRSLSPLAWKAEGGCRVVSFVLCVWCLVFVFMYYIATSTYIAQRLRSDWTQIQIQIQLAALALELGLGAWSLESE